MTRDDGAMREYGQYCPVALGSEVLAERWTPLILREMVLGSTRFNEIERGLPGISRSLLLKRLKQLERRGVVEIVEAPGGRGHEYHLTPAGRDLEEVIMTLGRVDGALAVQGAAATRGRPDHVDVVDAPSGRHRGDAGQPCGRSSSTTATPSRPTIWLVLDRGEPSVCMNHPGFDTDVLVTTDPVSLMRVFSGIDDLRACPGRRARAHRRAARPSSSQFESWFLWSPFAPAVRQRTGSTPRRLQTAP